MVTQVYELLYASAGYVLVAGFVVLVVLLIVAARRASTWRHEYDQLIATHHNLRDAYRELKTERGGGMLDLVHPDATLQAGELREYAEVLRGWREGEHRDDGLVGIAVVLEHIADELDPEDEAEAPAEGVAHARH